MRIREKWLKLIAHTYAYTYFTYPSGISLSLSLTHTHTQREHGMWLTHLNPCNEISNVTGSLFHLAERRREGKD